MSAGMPSTMGYLRAQALQTRRESSACKFPWQAGQASWATTEESNPVDAFNSSAFAGLEGMACADSVVSDQRFAICEL
jgi:hypothetical protein